MEGSFEYSTMVSDTKASGREKNTIFSDTESLERYAILILYISHVYSGTSESLWLLFKELHGAGICLISLDKSKQHM